MNVAALVAAAGKSERMGRTKALLPLGGDTFVTHLARVFARAGASPVVVTLPEGESAGLVRRALADVDVDARPNRRPEDGLAGSIATALSASPDADALVVCPVDMPFVTPALVSKLVDALFDAPDAVAAVPEVNDQLGHPVVVASELFAELMEPGLDGGLGALLRQHSARVQRVSWGDARVLANINTPEAFERWVARE